MQSCVNRYRKQHTQKSRYDCLGLYGPSNRNIIGGSESVWLLRKSRGVLAAVAQSTRQLRNVVFSRSAF